MASDKKTPPSSCDARKRPGLSRNRQVTNTDCFRCHKKKKAGKQTNRCFLLNRFLAVVFVTEKFCSLFHLLNSCKLHNKTLCKEKSPHSRYITNSWYDLDVNIVQNKHKSDSSTELLYTKYHFFVMIYKLPFLSGCCLRGKFTTWFLFLSQNHDKGCISRQTQSYKKARLPRECVDRSRKYLSAAVDLNL